ncbi:hypothetical protein HMPREF1015_01718 [Bacillus smithii 7_3_47FAA]|uniref:Uncharacterized protein n=1 Tax=Bacillus smithii 7_3_47FAA TaxID=665952 RepID=G9QKM9_9BACI|nr:hypothetical protein HMPREF1015_01718 [Bacillus smithii 7_3_47FAA]
MGNLFLFLCDEVKEMDFKTALLQLISLFQTLAEAKVYLSMDNFSVSTVQLDYFFTSLYQGLSSYFCVRKLSN